MKRAFNYFILLITSLGAFNTMAQDDHFIMDGVKHPIWYSKTRLLVKFRDIARAEISDPTKLTNKAKTIDRKPAFENMAFIDLEANLSKSDLDLILSDLVRNESVQLAHPLLITEDGKDLAGFTDIIIAKTKNEIKDEDLLLMLRNSQLLVTGMDPNAPKTYYLTGDPVHKDPVAVTNKLYETGLFEYVQPNCLRFLTIHGNPNDPMLSSNWGYEKMKLSEAWDITKGCSNIKIAVIDDGVQLNHPDLSANLLPGFDATPAGTSGGPVAGEFGHGTNVAGIAAGVGDNGIGVAGVAYGAKVIPVRAFSSNLSGGIVSSTDQYIAAAINDAVNNKNADVINMSWGVSSNNAAINTAIINALNNAASAGRGGKGCVLVGSTGNDGLAQILNLLPKSVSTVFMVGASQSNDTRWPGSNFESSYSSGAIKVDVVAPGPKVTTAVGSSYVSQTADSDNRTSWSAPAVSGIAALVLSVNPNLTQSQVRRIIAQTADKVGGYSYTVGNSFKFSDLSHHNEVGFGRVNALKALEMAAGGPITGPERICTTGSFSLTALPSGASVTWSTSSAGLSINSSGVATRQSGYSGEVSIIATLTIPGACASSSIKRKVWVGNPVISFQVNSKPFTNGYICSGSTAYIDVVSYSTGNSYTWSLQSGSTGSLSGSGSYATFSNYNIACSAIAVKATNSCGTTNTGLTICTKDCSGNSYYAAFPNPAKDVLTLQFEDSGDLENARVDLYSDKTKTSVLSVNMKDMVEQKKIRDGNKIDLNVGVLSRGIYYLHIQQNGKSDKNPEKIRISLE